MSEHKYLGGRGIMDRTDELNDRMWFWLLFAFPGAIAVMFGLDSEAGLPAPIAWLAVTVGGYCVARWILAGVAIERHTRAMNRETRKRGRGWADS